MRGEFIGVWSETWREIWLPLIDQEGVPEDIFCEIYREPTEALQAISTDMLAGFTPYLTDQLNADAVYRGQ